MSKKTILAFLKANNIFQNIDEQSISGIDDTVTASLSSWIFFLPLLDARKLTVDEVEMIIEKRTFTEDRKRFRAYLQRFSSLTSADIAKISAQNYQGFGRLSRKFLTGLLAPDTQNGREASIINMMWDHNLNLQQLLSDRYRFAKLVEQARREYYSQTRLSLAERLDEMYVSNAVKRPIIRSLTVLDEMVRAIGHAPAKIFVEMARDVTDTKKSGRTVSRKEQLLNLYRKIADDDARRLGEELEKYDDSALQKDTLYLYFMQLGRDMYTEEPIEDLSLYNKEHIYPQSKVKDDSLLNNMVLINSELNGTKKDIYPIDGAIREKMTPFWASLLKKGLITDEKFARLTRSTAFSDDEKWGFINRQLVETRQATKAVTELLKEKYPESEIVYVKAGLVADFRHEFGLLKSRTVNDLHHGKDAYLDIVVGNVWNEYFTRQWFADHSEKYSIKTEVVFTNIRKNCRGQIVWRGQDDLKLVEKTLRRNYLHLTSYPYCQHGGLFDQNPCPAKTGLIPLKKGKPTELYGGYNKPAASFFVFALTTEQGKKKKRELTLVAVDLRVADKFLSDQDFAVDYVKRFVDPEMKKSLSVEFPLGKRPIKVKSMFELDGGLRFLLNGKSGGGRLLLISLFTPLLLDTQTELYVKRLESFCEKAKKNAQLVYSEKFDKFSAGENIRLYDVLLNKLQTEPFLRRPANPVEALAKGRDQFVRLAPGEQAKLLLAIIGSLGRESGNGIDLKTMNGSARTGITTLSCNLSNWKKVFSTAYLVFSDSSGLHETKSVNLLELI